MVCSYNTLIYPFNACYAICQFILYKKINKCFSCNLRWTKDHVFDQTAVKYQIAETNCISWNFEKKWLHSRLKMWRHQKSRKTKKKSFINVKIEWKMEYLHIVMHAWSKLIQYYKGNKRKFCVPLLSHKHSLANWKKKFTVAEKMYAYIKSRIFLLKCDNKQTFKRNKVGQISLPYSKIFSLNLNERKATNSGLIVKSDVFLSFFQSTLYSTLN